MKSVYKLSCAIFLGMSFYVGPLMAQNASASQNAPKTAIKLSIDAQVKPTNKILDENVFGQFAEHLGTGIYPGVWVGKDSKIPNTRGIRNDVVGALKELKIPNIRWPGGCFADDYHWRHGIGPQETRPTRVNFLWGRALEPNSFGTHEFMDFVEQIGSNAYISGNMGSGSPQEMQDWLEYMTSDQPTTLAKERQANGREKPYKVKFFGVGNETWGCGGSMTAEFHANQYRNFATYVRNFDINQQKGNTKMLRIASGANADDYKWTEEMMKIKKDIIFSWGMDGLSLHYYSGYNQWPPHYSATNFGEDEYAHVIKSGYKMDTLIKNHSAIMDKYDPEKKVILVVDEWGAWYKPTEGTEPGFLQQQNSARDAVLAAVHFHVFSRHADRVRMANVAQLVNVLQAMVLTKDEKMVLTPTYHAFRMYVPFQGGTILPVQYEAPEYKFGDVTLPKVDIAAVKAKDGHTYIGLINIDHNNSQIIDIATLGLQATSYSGETLATAKIDAINTFDKPNEVKPRAINGAARNGSLKIELAPHSISVIKLN